MRGLVLGYAPLILLRRNVRLGSRQTPSATSFQPSVYPGKLFGRLPLALQGKLSEARSGPWYIHTSLPGNLTVKLYSVALWFWLRCDCYHLLCSYTVVIYHLQAISTGYLVLRNFNLAVERTGKSCRMPKSRFKSLELTGKILLQ